MNKNEILEKLEFKMNNFQIGDSALFKELMKLDKDDIIHDTDRAIIVTPLLEKIGDYSLIDYQLKEEETDRIAEICSINDEILMLESLNIVSLCGLYMSKLFEEEFHHPIVLLNHYKNILFCTQNNCFNLLADIIFVTDYLDEAKSILDLLDLINDTSVDIYESHFDINTIPRLKHYFKTSEMEGILSSLSTYIDKKIYLESGIDANHSLYNSRILETINNIKEKTCNFFEREFIEKYEENYMLNKIAHYRYINCCGKLQQYKEKCKKM